MKEEPTKTEHPLDGDREGGQKLMLQLEPEIHARVTGRPEGPQAYVERLVREDMAREPQGLPRGGEPVDAEKLLEKPGPSATDID